MTGLCPSFPPGDRSTGAASKSSRCEQDLNLRGETPLDFKSNAFTARPSQQLAQEVSTGAHGCHPDPGDTTGPDPTLTWALPPWPLLHTQHGYHCYCCQLPHTELQLIWKPASRQCWETELDTSHNISGGDTEEGDGGRSVSHLVFLYPAGNLSLDDHPQPPFPAWEHPSLLHPLLPPSICLCGHRSKPHELRWADVLRAVFCPVPGRTTLQTCMVFTRLLPAFWLLEEGIWRKEEKVTVARKALLSEVW